jgi:hypothetical protein
MFMNIKVYGAKQYWCQVPRIMQGFAGLGHNVGPSDKYDFVYANNFPYSSRDPDYQDCALDNDVFKIFNVLDIPTHISSFPIDQLKDELSHASVVTCISEPVKKQLHEIIGIDAYVIDNPIKDIFYDSSITKDINCLYVGRATDPVKRTHLLEPLFEEIISVGPFGGIGHNLGMVNDINLNQLYNRAKIVPLPSSFEGLGLTALEAMVCGAVPIVCSDNPNSELCPEFCICDPTKESISNKYQEILNNFEEYNKHIMLYCSNQIQHRFSKFQIAKNILNLYKFYTHE